VLGLCQSLLLPTASTFVPGHVPRQVVHFHQSLLILLVLLLLLLDQILLFLSQKVKLVVVFLKNESEIGLLL
jgi:hypothetical protein